MNQAQDAQELYRGLGRRIVQAAYLALAVPWDAALACP